MFSKETVLPFKTFASETEILLQAFPERNESSTDMSDFITENHITKIFCYSVGFNALNFYCRLHISGQYYHSFWLFINHIHIFWTNALFCGFHCSIEGKLCEITLA
jgi:hypothetical protein